MSRPPLTIRRLSVRHRLDRVGVLLSGLCVLHCVAGVFAIGMLGLSGGALLSPVFHEVGLVAAIAVGLVALGLGVMRHGQISPLVIGGGGIVLMALAVLGPHGVGEALLTIAGVSLVAFAHIRNLRHAC